MAVTFASWLRSQAHRDDSIGDLARDVRDDESWGGGSAHQLRGHMSGMGASAHAMDALTKAETEFARSQL